MADAVQAEFDACAAEVKTFEAKNITLSKDEMLNLYKFFKQATVCGSNPVSGGDGCNPCHTHNNRHL